MLNFIKSIFCNHQWKKIDENEIIQSYTVNVNIYPYKAKRILLACEKCGKLSRQVV